MLPCWCTFSRLGEKDEIVRGTLDEAGMVPVSTKNTALLCRLGKYRTKHCLHIVHPHTPCQSNLIIPRKQHSRYHA